MLSLSRRGDTKPSSGAPELDMRSNYHAGTGTGERSNYKRNADQLGMEVIGMLWEVGVGRFC
jgi:hypothetical protein